ncbi:uncharacterized protein [Anabrus simplex]|uniref:uncharacterized protein n=1 Tax=Anabrus simplex TaxID=316456 RepID=UPI0035A39E42
MGNIQGLPFTIWTFFLCYGSVSGGGFVNSLFPPVWRHQLDDSSSSLLSHVLGLPSIKWYQDQTPGAAYYSSSNGGDYKSRRLAPNKIISGSYPRSGFQDWPPPPAPLYNRYNPVTVFMDQLDKPIPNAQYGPPIMGNMPLNKLSSSSSPYIGTNEIWGPRPNFGILPNPKPWVNTFNQGTLINSKNQMWDPYNSQVAFPNGIRQINQYGLGITNRQNSRMYSNKGEIQAPEVFPFQAGDPLIPRNYIMRITNPDNQLTVRNPYGGGYPWVPSIPDDASERYLFPPIPVPPMQYPVQRLFPYIIGRYPIVYTNREDTLVEPTLDQNEHPVRQSDNQTKVQTTGDYISPSTGVYFRKRLDRTR